MDVICNRAALLELLDTAVKVVRGRTPKPVLQCVKLTATSDQLSAAATDMEMSVECRTAQVQVESPGVAVVSAAQLRDILRATTDDTVRLSLQSNNGVDVVGTDARFKLPGHPPADFPPIGGETPEPTFSVPAPDVRRLLASVGFAAAKEDGRYNIKGVLLLVRAGKLIAVATDGRRLAMADSALSTEAVVDDAKSIVPTPAVDLIASLVDGEQGPVGFTVADAGLTVATASAVMRTNLVEGTFPEYEDVIPKNADKKMTAGTADFLSAIRRAGLMTTEESKGVRFAFSKKGLTLTSRSPEAGEATVNFAAKYDGDDMEIGFAPAFLIDGLKAMDADETTLEMTAPNRPGLLRGGSAYSYVLMPVTLT